MVQRDKVPEEVMDRELYLLHVNALEDAGYVFEENGNLRLRVDGEFTVDGDDIDVEIGGTAELVFGEALSVAPDTTETVTTYNAMAGDNVTGFSANGESDGKFSLFIDGTKKITKQANQSNPNAEFSLIDGIEMNGGETVEVRVENIGLDSSDYNATITLQV